MRVFYNCCTTESLCTAVDGDTTTVLDDDVNSRLGRVVLREVFVVVSIEDRLRGIALSEGLRIGLAVDIVLGAAIDGEVRRLCHHHG